MKIPVLLMLVVSFGAWASYGVCNDGSISFNRDVRPILAETCFHCHGPDAHDRKGKLRLDIPDGADGAYRTHRGRVAIKPGDPKNSARSTAATSAKPANAMVSEFPAPLLAGFPRGAIPSYDVCAVYVAVRRGGARRPRPHAFYVAPPPRPGRRARA